jgi:hypothetical protein
VLFGQLTGAGTPGPVAAKLSAAKELVAQGVAPTVPGSPSQLTHAIVEGSHAAFMAGLHTAMIVAAAAAGVGAFLALLATTEEDAGPA